MTRFIFLLFFKYSPRDGPLKVKKIKSEKKKKRDLFFLEEEEEG